MDRDKVWGFKSHEILWSFLVSPGASVAVVTFAELMAIYSVITIASCVFCFSSGIMSLNCCFVLVSGSEASAISLPLSHLSITVARLMLWCRMSNPVSTVLSLFCSLLTCSFHSLILLTHRLTYSSHSLAKPLLFSLHCLSVTLNTA